MLPGIQKIIGPYRRKYKKAYQTIYINLLTADYHSSISSVRIDGQYLLFMSITPADAGVYYCSASNRFGNATKKAQVVVNRDHSYNVPLPIAARLYEVLEGHNMQIHCDVSPIYEPTHGGEIVVSFI